MTDRSKIIRHPAVVRAEFRRIRDALGSLMEELDQVADIADEMLKEDQ